jgi:hypothetical protein
MKTPLAFFLVLLCSASAFAADECTLIPPGHLDLNNRACVDSSAWGLAFEGYFFGDNPCFPSVDAAKQAMWSSYACKQAGSYFGSCRLLPPGATDANNHSCVDGSAWGLAYDGYFASDNPCYENADAAMSAMVTSYACQQPARRGACALLPPGGTDANNHSCVDHGAWGVTYKKSFISENPCFQSADAAMSAMNADGVCK